MCLVEYLTLTCVVFLSLFTISNHALVDQN